MKTGEAESVAAAAARMVTEADTRLTCRHVIQAVSETCGESRRTVRAVISGLVEAGVLRFAQDCGTCFLEKNYSGCVALSPHVTVAPPRVPVTPEHGCAVVRLMPGVSFGDCRHPTTRLSVRALDFFLTERPKDGPPCVSGLDIGTGSGILALVAVRLGVERVTAIDIDPCARKEAVDNVALNGCSDCIEVSGRELEQVEGPFSLVMANLRLPTLKRYAPRIDNLMAPRGGLVVSGIRTEETEALSRVYGELGTKVWQTSDGGWAAMVFIKNGPENRVFRI
ncbi:MAG: 50S ribosomal protein L11 methyltransferase [Thermodesulfobacteriota bacterium]